MTRRSNLNSPVRAVALTALALLGLAAAERAAAEPVGPADTRRAQCDAKWNTCIDNMNSWKDYGGIGITTRDVYKTCTSAYSSCMNDERVPLRTNVKKSPTPLGATAGVKREPAKQPITGVKSVASPAQVVQRSPSAGAGAPGLKPVGTLQMAPLRPAGPAAFKLQGR